MWRGTPQYAFGLGLVAGALASAFVVLVVGSLLRLAAPRAVWAAAVGIWFVVIAVRELGLISFRLPQNARLVPATVFRHGPFWGPVQFGLEMGSGVRTYVTSGLPYVLVAAIAVLASWPAALAAGVGFGLGRMLMTSANLRFSADGEWDLVFAARQRVIGPLLLLAAGLSLVLIVAG